MALEAGGVLCFQQSSGDSTGPEVDVATPLLADRSLNGDVGELDAAARLEHAVQFGEHRVLVRDQVDDASFDVVISNGVIDLIPDKDAVFDELFRVLRAGGRLQLADVTIQRPVSEEGRRNIDLWTG